MNKSDIICSMSPVTVLDTLRHKLIVSVQASKGEPLYDVSFIHALCCSVLGGGAAGLRLAHPDHIKAIKASHPHIPVIGLTKPEVLPMKPEAEVYITPTLQDALTLIDAGADIIAMDATLRARPNGETLESIVHTLKQHSRKPLLMADIDTFEAGIKAQEIGFDLISTTLSGYTTESLETKSNDLPDFDLLQNLVQLCSTPIVLEGRVWEPQQVKQALAIGAYAVVVGSAITRPQLITQRFQSFCHF